MNIDTHHLHYWMQAIRQSNNPMRTMEAFWSGQLKSKEWLILHLSNFIHQESDIEIHGGWVGVLASMIFQSNLPIKNIISVDIDPLCKHVSEEMNRIEHTQGKFKAEISDMIYRHPRTDIVINTSAEHITQAQHDIWLSNMLDNQIIVLQSNDYAIDEHIRIAKNLDDFTEQAKLSKIIFKGELELPMYKRFMIIGYK